MVTKNSKGEHEMINLSDDLQQIFSGVEMGDNAKKAIIQSVILKVESAVSLATLQEKLKVLYEYEKNYLGLLKEYKEEIKFAANIQEDLRKERTKFFSEALKEVSETLKESQVDSKVASIWIKELVTSYTKSLDLSSGLIEEQALDMIGEIRQEAKKEVKSIKTVNDQSQDEKG
ncbi:MAG: nickel transporter [Thermodesulfobacteriota bacterium]|nr:nickel transporter [Thermodesulfobacteriota bacterium]